MTARLPRLVKCCVVECGRVVPRAEAKREVVAWAAAGKGGTLSGVSRLRTTGRWMCRRCLAQGKPAPPYETTDEARERARRAIEPPTQRRIL